jgi:hypothetical protein
MTPYGLRGKGIANVRRPGIDEASMLTPMFRYTLFCATILLASIATPQARAQDPTDLPVDFLFKGIHEWELERHQARLQNDIDRGDAAGMNRDLNRIQRDEWRLWYDRRRIRRDMWLPAGPWVPLPRSIPPGETLIAHPQYPGYGYYASNPTQLYQLPQPEAPSILPTTTAETQFAVVISNAGPSGATIDYVIDGVAYSTESSQHQRLVVSPRSTIVYNRGGDLGVQRYSLSAGVYEFQSHEAGWALFKLKPPPADAGRSLSVVVPKNDLPATTRAH